MTAPPPQMPLFALADAHFHAAAPYLSPASTASDSAFSWTSMAALQHHNRRPSRPKSMSPQGPPSNENHASANNSSLLFITGTSPADLKSKKNMTKVRKKAMAHHLSEKEKKGDASSKEQQQQRSRLKSEDSTGSSTSVGTGQQEFISNSDALGLLRGDSKRPKQHASSPASTEQEQPDMGREMQISRIPRPSVDFVLPSAPIVLPSRTGVKLDYDSFTPRPFQSIGKPLDPFRAMYQASHPRVSVEELKWHCSRSFGTRAMGSHWIPTLVKSPHAFLSTLCIASAHFDAVNELLIESVQTLALRQEVMHLISQNLVNPTSRVDDFNVIALTQLIASEMIAGEETALNFHEAGVEAMIKQRGGANQLGANGRIASTVSWVSLESAILREAKPRSIYVNHCSSTSSKHYPNTATVPESPLCCPRGEFETIRRSQRCTPRAMDLLKDIRMMMDLFLHETQQSRKNSLSLKNIYKKITTEYPSAAELEKTNVLTLHDWTYEAIRITSILTATAIIQRIPLSSALPQVAESENPQPFFYKASSSSASRSAESLVSPTNLRHDSPVTSFSTSPSFTTSPAFQQPNPFNFVPAAARPSTSSTTSDSYFLSATSDTAPPIFFPAPPAPTPTGPNALLAALKLALQNSDLSECWSDMAGVLLWIALTIGAASRTSDKVLKKWFRALAVRISIVLCFEHPEAVHATMVRMGELVEGVGYAKNRSASTTGGAQEVVQRESNAETGTGTGTAKRRRV